MNDFEGRNVVVVVVVVYLKERKNIREDIARVDKFLCHAGSWEVLQLTRAQRGS